MHQLPTTRLEFAAHSSTAELLAEFSLIFALGHCSYQLLEQLSGRHKYNRRLCEFTLHFSRRVDFGFKGQGLRFVDRLLYSFLFRQSGVSQAQLLKRFDLVAFVYHTLSHLENEKL